MRAATGARCGWWTPPSAGGTFEAAADRGQSAALLRAAALPRRIVDARDLSMPSRPPHASTMLANAMVRLIGNRAHALKQSDARALCVALRCFAKLVSQRQLL